MSARRRLALGAVCLAAGLATVTSATPAGSRQADAYASCRAKATTTLAIDQCISTELQRVDLRLNRTYRKLLGTLSASRKVLVSASEQRWIAFRDAECRFAASKYEGGSLAPVVAGDCRIDLTKRRTLELERHLEGP